MACEAEPVWECEGPPARDYEAERAHTNGRAPALKCEAEQASEIGRDQARAKGPQRASEGEQEWEPAQKRSSERGEPAEAIERHKAQAAEPSWKRESWPTASRLPLLR